jgi:tight adherence protein B
MTAIAILASSAGFLVVLFLFLATNSPEENIESKIKRLTAEKDSTLPKEKPSWKNYVTLLARFTPKKWAKQLDLALLHSGIPLNGGEFIVMQCFLLIFLSLLALMLAPLNKLIVILPILGIIFPRLYLSHCLNVKTRRFNNQLADVLLILANSLKAGFSLLQSMEMASQEMPDPISSEIKITLREMTYGESTENALLNFSQRIKSKDLELMVTAILIQRQIGGNLAEILLSIHGTIQDRLRIQAEVKSLTAQGRLSGYIIAFIPFGMAMIIGIIQPDYLGKLIHSSVGMFLIVAGIISQIIGFLAINKIVNIKI